MKRSHNVLKKRFIKKPVSGLRAPLALGITATFVLTGCGESITYEDFTEGKYSTPNECTLQNPYQAEDCNAAYQRYLAEREVEAKIYSSVEECVEFNPDLASMCKSQFLIAQQTADASAPMFETRTLCLNEYEFCDKNYSGYWRPRISGFLLAEIIDEVGDVIEARYRYSRSVPVYSSRSGYKTGQGHVLGSSTGRAVKVKHRQTNVSSKPRVTLKKKKATTISRGGFGSTAKAKSKWSKKSSWGG